jgi:MFS family permease
MTPLSKMDFRKGLFFFMGWVGMVFYFTQRWIYGPVIPALMADFQISKTTAGLIGSASLWGYMLTPIIAGLLSDHYGRKYTALAGIFGFSVLTLLAGFVPGTSTLFLVRFLTGITEAFFFIPMIAFTLELFPERPGFYITLMSSGSSLGWFTGPALAGWLLDLTNKWRAPFITTGSLSLIAAILLFLFWPKQTKQAEPKPFFDRSILLPANYILLAILSLATAFQIAAEFGFTMWYPAYLKLELGLTATAAGVLAGFFGLGQFIGRPSMGWVLDRVAYRPVGILGSLAIGFSILCILATNNPVWLGVFTFLAGFIGAAAMGALWTFTGLVFAPFKGLALGVITTIGYVAASLAPILIGRLGDQSSVAIGLRYISVPAAFLAGLVMLATFMVRPRLIRKS